MAAESTRKNVCLPLSFILYSKMTVPFSAQKKFILLVIGFFTVLLPLKAIAQEPPSDITHTFILIGDAGEPHISSESFGTVVREQIAKAGDQTTVLYLGDNLYPDGLPAPGSKFRGRGEQILQTQASWVKGLGAQGIFIPGNHDWQHWGRKGLEYIGHQQQWVDSLHEKNITFQPQNGCPGPVEKIINDKLVLVILDTQWFLHQYNKPAEEGPCDAKTTADVLTLLADIFERHHDKRIIVAGHHPIVTYGEHGGVFRWKDHLFPLTDMNRHLYIPLPVIGSFYPMYRKLFGHIQDTAHPTYKEFSEPLAELLKENPGSIYVAGHEHALEHSVKDGAHYVVSGAGSKVSFVRKKGHARFAESKRGFAQLSVHKNGDVSLRFFEVAPGASRSKEIYSTEIPAQSSVILQDSSQLVDFSGKIIRVKASEQYHAGGGRKKMFGENYRKEWEQETDVPVFDIGTEKGGLKILQKGGGQQTLSLRMEDSTGHEYVVRSVEKFPEKAVPEMFRKTFAQDIVQDQISASHPYAALAVAGMAEAAGIYHTNPKLVYIPDDPRLKEYRKTFGNTLALFEERPAGDWSKAANFGNSKKIINTSKVLEKLAEDNDNQVDQEFVLKSRLFDMVIGDWDRHDDQWRWATMGGKKGNTFRPIPRDRDQAFFVNEGMLSKLFSRKWALPKFEGFDEEIEWPSGLSFNARYFDRTFLTGLPEEKWIEAAQKIQHDLTDESIENAIHQLPPEIFALHGDRIIRHIKVRRDKLQTYAVSHYKFLSREVDVVGSDKRERFEVDRLADGNTHVRIYKISKENEITKVVYDRNFKKNETKEIRLYGLGGDDQFGIHGSARNAILLRVIGGDGKDILSDSSKVSGWSKRTVFYDQRGQGEFHTDGEVKDNFSDDPSVNAYDRKSFQFNRLAPLLYGNYNPDDGIFLGGGLIGFTHGFRKNPFKQRHLFLASVAPLTWSFNFRYQGKFTEVIGKWNIELQADIKSPNYVNNFFGLGNESVFDKEIEEDPSLSVEESIQYYRYRFEELRLEPSISRNFGGWGTLKIGPSLQRIEMEDPEPNKDRFIESYAATLDHNIFDEYNSFLGGFSEFIIDKRNHPTFTSRGILLNTSGRIMEGLNKNSRSFSSYEGSLAIYHSFRSNSRLTFAVRAGAGVNTGTYEFYQAQVLDGKTELRGFRKTRFYGDRKFYSNFEMRVKLIRFRSYLFPASLGVMAFHDLGRVWYKNADGIDPTAEDGVSSVWHKGVGGGIWFTPFNLTVVSTEVAHSKDGFMAYVRLGFMF
jgi:hypothetical protein